MNRRVFFILSFLIIFLTALILLNILKDISKEKKIEEEEKIEHEEKNIIEYKANQTIRVKITSRDEIIAMDINDYLRGVLPAEMPPYYDINALKAQAIVARTYLYRKMNLNSEGENVDICDSSSHCQAFYDKETILRIWANKGWSEDQISKYWDNVNKAVTTTQNEVITYNGEFIRAYFHASSPKRTENSNQIWGKENIPYLVSVENVESEDYQNRFSTVEISFKEFYNKLKENNLINDIYEIKKGDIVIYDYTTSGRVNNISVCENLISAEKLRTLFSLKSTLFTIEESEESIKFNVIGYGHGLGMSQVGANYLAQNGYDYKDIIKYYYKGVEIEKIDEK